MARRRKHKSQRVRQRGIRGKPWYRSTRDQWFATIGSAKVLLVDKRGEPIRGEDNRPAAEQAWHELAVMAAVPYNGADNETRTILELYLQDMERREVSAKSIEQYRTIFKSFLSTCPKLVRDLRPAHIHQWWETKHKKWGNSTKNLSGTAIKAAFRWAVLPGKGGAIIPRNPFEGMSLPTMRKRSSAVIVSEKEFKGLMTLVKSSEVRDILTVSWETGTRPVNLSRATKANLTEDGNALFFADWNSEPGSAVHKTFKQTGRPLIVPLSDKAREVCQRLAKENSEGPLFRSTRGLQWSDNRLASIVHHYAKRAGLKGRFTAYSCRHTRATALLEAGFNDTDVAAILGNTPGVIHRNYSHVAAKVNRLRNMLNKSRNTKGT